MSRLAFRVGDRVDGLYDGNSDDVWYPGVIEAAHKDATTATMTFDVLYDDGEREYGVIVEYLRPHQHGTICVGTRVFGRYSGGDEWYPGKILEVQDDATFTIEYDDGEIEAGVVLDCIRESLEVDAEPSQIEAEPPEQAEPVPVQAMETAPASSQAKESAANSEAEASPEPLIEQRRTPSPAPEQEATAALLVAEVHTQADEDNQHHAVHNVDDGRVDDTNPQELSAGDTKNHYAVHADAGVDAEAGAADDRIHHSVHDHNTQATTASTSTSAPTRSTPSPSLPAATAIDEYATVLDAVEQLTTGDLSDPLATKSVLSTLVKQLRASPQATAELLHARDGERLLVAVLQTHHAHAVLQCYGFVLLRRLCFLCGKSAHLLLRLGVLDVVLRAMQRFADDAILQAAACGALAVFTRLPTGLTALLERRVAHLVLATLLLHKAYSVHTRQVHYYASEVLLELCELGDRTTLDALCGDHLTTAPAALRSDGSPIALLLGLLRQALSFDDKKASCAVATLLLCLAACHGNAALLLVTLNGLPELSTVMAAYATEPGVQKYAVAASQEIARCAASMPELSPSKRVQATAHELLLSSLPSNGTGKTASPPKGGKAARASSQPTTKKASKKKAKKPTTTFVMTTANGSVTVSELNGFATPAGAAQRLDAVVAQQRRDPLSFSRYASPQGKAPPHLPSKLGIAPSPTSYHYAAAPTPPPPHAFASEMMAQDNDKRQRFVRDERQQLLFDTYGVDAQQATAHSHSHSGIKRRQLKTHVVSAGSVKRPAGSLSSRVETETPAMAAHRRQQDDGDGSSEELSPSTLRRRDQQQQQQQQQQQRPKAPRATYQLDLTRSQISVPPQSPVVLSPTTSTARSAPKKPKKKTTSTTATLSARKSAPHGVSRPKPTSRRLPETPDQSHESLSAFATQLFRDDDGDAATTAAMEPRKPVTSQHERERLSFAEKLHKMIDRAKSTLAHSSTTDLETVSSPKKPVPTASSVAAKPKTVGPASTGTATATARPSAPVIAKSSAVVRPAAPVAAPKKPATTTPRVTARTSTPKGLTPAPKTTISSSTTSAKPKTPSTSVRSSSSSSTVQSPRVSKAQGSTTVSPAGARAPAPAPTPSPTSPVPAAETTEPPPVVEATPVAAAVDVPAPPVASSLDNETKELESDDTAPAPVVPVSEPLPATIESSPAPSTELAQQTEKETEVEPQAAPSDAAEEDAVPPQEPLETTEEAAAETTEEATESTALVAAAAAVAAAVVVKTAADDLYADEFDDDLDTDTADLMEPTTADNAMNDGVSFEALMHLTAQVTGAGGDSDAPAFSVARPDEEEVVEASFVVGAESQDLKEPEVSVEGSSAEANEPEEQRVSTPVDRTDADVVAVTWAETSEIAVDYAEPAVDVTEPTEEKSVAVETVEDGSVAEPTEAEAGVKEAADAEPMEMDSTINEPIANATPGEDPEASTELMEAETETTTETVTVTEAAVESALEPVPIPEAAAASDRPESRQSEVSYGDYDDFEAPADEQSETTVDANDGEPAQDTVNPATESSDEPSQDESEVIQQENELHVGTAEASAEPASSAVGEEPSAVTETQEPEAAEEKTAIETEAETVDINASSRPESRMTEASYGDDDFDDAPEDADEATPPSEEPTENEPNVEYSEDVPGGNSSQQDEEKEATAIVTEVEPKNPENDTGASVTSAAETEMVSDVGPSETATTEDEGAVTADVQEPQDHEGAAICEESVFDLVKAPGDEGSAPESPPVQEQADAPDEPMGAATADPAPADAEDVPVSLTPSLEPEASTEEPIEEANSSETLEAVEELNTGPDSAVESSTAAAEPVVEADTHEPTPAAEPEAADSETPTIGEPSYSDDDMDDSPAVDEQTTVSVPDDSNRDVSSSVNWDGKAPETEEQDAMEEAPRENEAETKAEEETETERPSSSDDTVDTTREHPSMTSSVDPEISIPDDQVTEQSESVAVAETSEEKEEPTPDESVTGQSDGEEVAADTSVEPQEPTPGGVMMEQSESSPVPAEGESVQQEQEDHAPALAAGETVEQVETEAPASHAVNEEATASAEAPNVSMQQNEEEEVFASEEIPSVDTKEEAVVPVESEPQDHAAHGSHDGEAAHAAAAIAEDGGAYTPAAESAEYHDQVVNEKEETEEAPKAIAEHSKEEDTEVITASAATEGSVAPTHVEQIPAETSTNYDNDNEFERLEGEGDAAAAPVASDPLESNDAAVDDPPATVAADADPFQPSDQVDQVILDQGETEMELQPQSDTLAPVLSDAGAGGDTVETSALEDIESASPIATSGDNESDSQAPLSVAAVIDDTEATEAETEVAETSSEREPNESESVDAATVDHEPPSLEDNAAETPHTDDEPERDVSMGPAVGTDVNEEQELANDDTTTAGPEVTQANDGEKPTASEYLEPETPATEKSEDAPADSTADAADVKTEEPSESDAIHLENQQLHEEETETEPTSVAVETDDVTQQENEEAPVETVERAETTEAAENESPLAAAPVNVAVEEDAYADEMETEFTPAETADEALPPNEDAVAPSAPDESVAPPNEASDHFIESNDEVRETEKSQEAETDMETEAPNDVDAEKTAGESACEVEPTAEPLLSIASEPVSTEEPPAAVDTESPPQAEQAPVETETEEETTTSVVDDAGPTPEETPVASSAVEPAEPETAAVEAPETDAYDDDEDFSVLAPAAEATANDPPTEPSPQDEYEEFEETEAATVVPTVAAVEEKEKEDVKAADGDEDDAYNDFEVEDDAPQDAPPEKPKADDEDATDYDVENDFEDSPSEAPAAAAPAVAPATVAASPSAPEEDEYENEYDDFDE